MFVYTLPAISTNVSMHYCGGELASISFFSDNSDGCVCGVKKMKRSCCETKHLSFTFKDSHQKADVVALKSIEQTELQLLPDFSAFTFVMKKFYVLNIHHNFNDPPNSFKEPLYLLNRTLRI